MSCKEISFCVDELIWNGLTSFFHSHVLQWEQQFSSCVWRATFGVYPGYGVIENDGCPGQKGVHEKSYHSTCSQNWDDSDLWYQSSFCLCLKVNEDNFVLRTITLQRLRLLSNRLICVSAPLKYFLKKTNIPCHQHKLYQLKFYSLCWCWLTAELNEDRKWKEWLMLYLKASVCLFSGSI